MHAAHGCSHHYLAGDQLILVPLKHAIMSMIPSAGRCHLHRQMYLQVRPLLWGHFCHGAVLPALRQQVDYCTDDSHTCTRCLMLAA